MKKVLFILTLVTLAACNTTTSTKSDPDTLSCDSAKCDSTTCDSLKK